MKYPIGNPSITQQEIDSVVATLVAGRLTQGESVVRFEKRLSDYLQVKHVIACSSGTAALHLALAAIGIGPGDEVLVPDLTYVATANAVTYVGATPVLVDVSPNTWNISLEDAERKVSSRTRAILPVHLYGIPCDMDALSAFAADHAIDVIEDAAEALGGYWKGDHCGTFGLCGTFSFYANKIITTGEGGAVVTDDDKLSGTLRYLRGQAVSPTRRFWHGELGFNYRMTDVHAAIGLAQLNRLDEFLTERRRVVSGYAAVLDSPIVLGTSPWLYTGLLPKGVSFGAVEQQLVHRQIETRPVFVPMHRLPMYARPDSQFPVSCELSDRGMSLPTYPSLTDEDVKYISDSVLEAIQ